MLQIYFGLLAAGAARTHLAANGTTLLTFEGPRFAAAHAASALRIYVQTPTSLALHATTTLRACQAGAHLPALACVLDATPTAPAAPALQVGALYEGWHAPPAHAQSMVRAQGGAPLAVEDVLRSGGALRLADIFAKYPGAAAQTDGFYYQEQPALGYYCLYRARPGQPGLIPDCLNISGTVAAHSAWLTGASIDFITLDATNLCTPSDQEELIQQRPMEVMLEELLRLRSAGVPTPRVAAWQRMVTGCTTYPALLALYNNASYIAADLFLTAPATGKRVLFVPADPDPALVALVESNGGRNDIVTQVMWALFSQKDYAADGEWGFMSPCTDERGGYTTSVVGLGRGARGCSQNFTTHSALGSALAVSPSYQLSYGSVPFSAAGKFEGVTLQRQFGTLFEAAGRAWAGGAGAPALPDNLYLSSFNEWTSQPQANPFGSNFSFSMGLGSDPDGRALFVDSYGSSLSRDLEPSARPGGSDLFNLLTSCLRVVRLMEGLGSHHAAQGSLPTLARFFGAPGAAVSCSVAGEACCAYNETVQGYALSRSLVRLDARDALVSTDAAEVAALLASGQWEEVCNGYGGGTDFCVDGRVLQSQRLAGGGPFLLHSGGCGAAVSGSGADASVVLPGRALVQRCRGAAPSDPHFLWPDASCNGGEGVAEAIVGCADTQRSSNMPRALYACSSSSSSSSSSSGAPPRYTSLDVGCLPGDGQRLLGYAH